MMRSTRLLITTMALVVAAPVSADDLGREQARVLRIAAEEERDEPNNAAAKVFERLAEQAEHGAVTTSDLPERWQTGLKTRGRKREEQAARLAQLEQMLGALTPSQVHANLEAVVHAQVDLFHVRHELSEPRIHVNSATQYLDHAEADLSNLRSGDRDGDGIPDADDACPDDPEDRDGFEDSNGCPDPDNDRDGIPDVNDACPNRPENRNGFQDLDGCPDVAALEAVYFASDSARLDARARATLTRAAQVLGATPGVGLHLVGFCDSRNSNPYNEDLGMRRAIAVRRYLVSQHGIAASRLGVGSLGESGAVADNTTSAGRALNRRVELRVISGR